ncbi:hypothetical protein THAOC_08720, partial [Thalassiosira oceanica]
MARPARASARSLLSVCLASWAEVAPRPSRFLATPRLVSTNPLITDHCGSVFGGSWNSRGGDRKEVFPVPSGLMPPSDRRGPSLRDFSPARAGKKAVTKIAAYTRQRRCVGHGKNDVDDDDTDDDMQTAAAGRAPSPRGD